MSLRYSRKSSCCLFAFIEPIGIEKKSKNRFSLTLANITVVYDPMNMVFDNNQSIFVVVDFHYWMIDNV